jgi:hypothetical protein
MTTLLEAAAAGLRASADVHEAERIPHLVPALRALADALDAYQPVEPGPCPGRLELRTVRADGAGGLVHGVDVLTCRLRATHAGLHEESPYLDGRQPARWGDPIDVAPALDWDEERSHLVVEDDDGNPFLSGCDCEIGRDHYAPKVQP